MVTIEELEKWINDVQVLVKDYVFATKRFDNLPYTQEELKEVSELLKRLRPLIEKGKIPFVSVPEYIFWAVPHGKYVRMVYNEILKKDAPCINDLEPLIDGLIAYFERIPDIIPLEMGSAN